MKKNILKIFLFLAVIHPLFSQDDEKPLTELSINRLNTRMQLSGSLGVFGSTASSLGDQILWSRSDASSVSWNPASLPFVEGRSVVIDWVPGFSTKIASLYDIDSKVQSQMDQVIQDNGTPECTVRYPDMDSRIGFRGLFSGLGVAVPFQIMGRNAGIGLGYFVPLQVSLDLLGTGIEAGIDTEQKIQDNMERIRMRTRMNLNGDLGLTVTQFQIGGGIALRDDWSLGLTFSRIMVDASLNVFARIDGLIEKSGTEYAFNDPDDPRINFEGENPETNELNQTLTADFSGSGWGFKIGVIHPLNELMQLGMVIHVAPRIRTIANKYSLVHTIPFIHLDDDSAETLSDRIDATKINLAKLTLTERTLKDETYDVELHLPSALHFGFLYQRGNFTMGLRLTQYLGELSYVIVGHESRGFKMKQGFGIGLDFKYFFLGSSVIFMDEILPVDSDADPMKNLPYPKFNLGFRVPVYEALWSDFIIGVEPTPLVRFSFRYSF